MPENVGSGHMLLKNIYPVLTGKKYPGKFAAAMFFATILLTVFSISAHSAGKTAVELRRIAQAGASLVLDLDKSSYTVVELAQIAASLAKGCTLTIISADSGRLSTSQCLQIASAKPGQIIFWFGR